MNRPSAQILSSKEHIPIKKPERFGEMDDSRTGVWKIQNELEILVMPKSKKIFK